MKKIKNNYTLREAVVKTLGDDEENLFDLQILSSQLVEQTGEPQPTGPSYISIKNKFTTWYLRGRNSRIGLELEDDIGTTEDEFKELVETGKIIIKSSQINCVVADGLYLQKVNNPDADYGANLNGNTLLSNYSNQQTFSSPIVIEVLWVEYGISDTFSFTIPPYDLELEVDPTFGSGDYSRIKLYQDVPTTYYFQYRGYVTKHSNTSDPIQITNVTGGGEWQIYPYIKEGIIEEKLNGVNVLEGNPEGVEGYWEDMSENYSYEAQVYHFIPQVVQPLTLSFSWTNGQTTPNEFTIEVYTRIISWDNPFDIYPTNELETYNELIELKFSDDWNDGTDYAALLDSGDAILSVDSEDFEIVDNRYISMVGAIREEQDITITISYPYYQTASSFTFKVYPVRSSLTMTTDFTDFAYGYFNHRPFTFTGYYEEDKLLELLDEGYIYIETDDNSIIDYMDTILSIMGKAKGSTTIKIGWKCGGSSSMNFSYITGDGGVFVDPTLNNDLANYKSGSFINTNSASYSNLNYGYFVCDGYESAASENHPSNLLKAKIEEDYANGIINVCGINILDHLDPSGLSGFTIKSVEDVFGTSISVTETLSYVNAADSYSPLYISKMFCEYTTDGHTWHPVRTAGPGCIYSYNGTGSGGLLALYRNGSSGTERRIGLMRSSIAGVYYCDTSYPEYPYARALFDAFQEIVDNIIGIRLTWVRRDEDKPYLEDYNKEDDRGISIITWILGGACKLNEETNELEYSTDYGNILFYPNTYPGFSTLTGSSSSTYYNRVKSVLDACNTGDNNILFKYHRKEGEE